MNVAKTEAASARVRKHRENNREQSQDPQEALGGSHQVCRIGFGPGAQLSRKACPSQHGYLGRLTSGLCPSLVAHNQPGSSVFEGLTSGALLDTPLTLLP